MAKSFWSLCETWYGQEIAWIKIEALSKLISDVMAQPPPHSKRRRTDPEAMQGYREVESLEDYEKRSERGSEAPPPRVRKKKKKVRPRAGPRKRSGRPGPRKGPRR